MVVLKDLPDPPDQLELEEWLDPKDHAETRERPARQERGDRRATAVSLDSRVFPDPLVLLVTPVLLDLPDLAEPRDHLDQSDPLDPVDALENPVLLVLPVTPDPPDPQDLPAPASTCLRSPACPRRRSPRTRCGT